MSPLVSTARFSRRNNSCGLRESPHLQLHHLSARPSSAAQVPRCPPRAGQRSPVETLLHHGLAVHHPILIRCSYPPCESKNRIAGKQFASVLPHTIEQPQACSTSWSDAWRLPCKAKKKKAAFVGKVAPASAGQTGKQFASAARTTKQPQACSIR